MEKHKELSEILEKHTFVGIVDLHQCLHATKLCNLPPPLCKLIETAVELQETTEESGLTKPEVVERIAETLAAYFSFRITPTWKIESLPLLLREYTPNLDKLPAFLMCLGPQSSSSFSSRLRAGFGWLEAGYVLPRPTLIAQALSAAMSLLGATSLDDLQLFAHELKPTTFADCHVIPCCHVSRLLGAIFLDDLHLAADESKLDNAFQLASHGSSGRQAGDGLDEAAYVEYDRLPVRNGPERSLKLAPVCHCNRRLDTPNSRGGCFGG
ncbi:hypothetical protein C8F01DRAFT_1249066 [Mycena amicta]|nr:hypothetical protein C8F01DRAFT_1249066 [Mycena amicta]